jgi:UPF0716 protein FxsA
VIGVLLFLLILAVPFVELYVIVQVWQAVGGLETLALLVLVSVLGAWLVKREGTSVWRRLNAQLAEGNVPANEAIDGAFILFAGALLLTPGFVTDMVAILLLLPPIRAGLRVGVRRIVRNRLVERGPIRVVRWGAWGADRARDWVDGDPEIVDITEAAPESTSAPGSASGHASPPRELEP